MVAGCSITFVPQGQTFDYESACQIGRRLNTAATARVVIVDLSQTEKADTSAFARLVWLRGCLLREKRDLRLVGLRGRALALYQVCRLTRLLPS